MYTWEIRDLINSKGRTITREEYFHILKTSPQINKVTYCGGYTFRIEAEELNIKFNVKAA